MDIAFAFDEGYADHAQVAIESILDCHGHRDDLTFWLLTTSQVTADRAESLRDQAEGRARLEFLAVDDRYRSLPASQLDLCRYISTAMYLRLFLPQLLPSRVDRLLYLDADVLVNGDLAALWDVPLGDAPLAAVRDNLARSMGYEGGVPGAGPEVRGSAPYFNSGVLLMNLPAWRRLEITDRCLRYLVEHRDRLRFPDQDALNLVCYDRWVRLKSIWNDTILWWLKADDHATVRQSVRITHFVGPVKPWLRGFPFTGYRDRYHELAARVPGLRLAEQAEAPMFRIVDCPAPDESTMDGRRVHDLLPNGPWLVAAGRDAAPETTA
jgi:lipopolysaccharide biosynthesis glycosyltransferase